MARICEQAERYADMVDFMKPVLEVKGAEMSVDERQLTCVAFKNLVNSKRVAWRTVKAVQNNVKYQLYIDSIKEYQGKLEDGIFADCQQIITIVQNHIIKKKGNGEAKAFFLKILGDNYRYIAEISTGERRQKAVEGAIANYEEGFAIELPPCNTTRLSLSLNLSVFYQEIMHEPEKAKKVANKTLTGALEKIDDLAEDEFKDTKIIIDLIKENLQVWNEPQKDS